MSKNKFETLIEYIINDDEAKAKALFHKIVIEKSRDIYESLTEEDSPVPDGQDVEGLEDEIEGDETGDTDDLDGIEGEDDFAADDEFDDEAAVVDGEEEGLEDRVMDLEDAIDELKAEFDALMAEEELEPEHQDGEEVAADDEVDLDADEDDLEGDEVVDDEELDADEEVADDENNSIYGESRNMRKSPSDLMREYVEKVTVQKPVEGDAVGAGTAGGAKVAVNTKSTTIGGKNDMGGSAKNIAQGGAEQVPTGPKKPSNAYAKGEKKMGQDKYENSPGANTKGYADKKSAPVKKEEAGVNDESIVGESRKPRSRKPAIKG